MKNIKPSEYCISLLYIFKKDIHKIPRKTEPGFELEASDKPQPRPVGKVFIGTQHS